MGYDSLVNEFNLTQTQVADRVGKRRAHITNFLRLLQLDEELKTLLSSQKLSMGHAKVLLGVEDEKIAAIWEFESSDLFSDAERAALSFAQAAAQVPNAVTDDDFAQLRKYFTEFQIVEIMSVVSLFGYLNRWNDTMATTLEKEPTDFAHRAINETGWTAGKHAAAE